VDKVLLSLFKTWESLGNFEIFLKNYSYTHVISIKSRPTTHGLSQSILLKIKVKTPFCTANCSLNNHNKIYSYTYNI
jgi:hypothetical protein